MNEELAVPCVVVDDYLGVFNATQHLIDQGCKRIAHIAGQQHVPIFKKRMNGYLQLCEKMELLLIERLIKYGNVSISSGTKCMNTLVAAAVDS